MVVEEGAQGAVGKDDLEVAAADRFAPPFVVDMPDVLDVSDAAGTAALVEDEGETAASINVDLHWLRQVQGSYAISACLRSGRRDHGSTSATRKRPDVPKRCLS